MKALRECLDLLIVLNEHHLRRLLRSYLAYYNVARPHQSRARQAGRDHHHVARGVGNFR